MDKNHVDIDIKKDMKISANLAVTPVCSVHEFTVRCDARDADKVKKAIEKALEEIYDADN